MTRSHSSILLSFCLLSSLFSAAQDSSTAKPKKNFNFTVLPMVSFNLSKGFGIGLMSSAFYNLSKKDTVSPASMSSLVLRYSTNGSWFTVIGQRMYFNQDNWRVALGVGYFNNNFQTYTDAPGTEDVVVPYNTKMKFVALVARRRVYKRLYAGASLQLGNAKTDFEDDSSTSTEARQNALGLNLLNDSRDNVYYPGKGIQASFSAVFFTSWLGNEIAFPRLSAYCNYYHSFSEKNIIAARLFTRFALGDSIPFVAESNIGGKDLRGYSSGQYRDAQVYDVQVEDRWNFYKKWGAVAFAGLAVTNSSSNGFSSLLPAAGVGLRYRIIPARKVNVGIDVAVGKGDWGLYFRIGEAF